MSSVDENVLSFVNVWIYGLIDPIDHQVKYIGKTWSTNQRHTAQKVWQLRLNSHVCAAKIRNKSNVELWICSLLDQGIKPIMVIIECTSLKHWASREQFWIKKYRLLGYPLTNITIGGNAPSKSFGRQGRPHSEETKRKMSLSHTGKKLSDSHRANMSRGQFKRWENTPLEGRSEKSTKQLVAYWSQFTPKQRKQIIKKRMANNPKWRNYSSV